jgi:hypothetical protein
MTSALDGGEWSASRSGRGLPPGKGPPVITGQEAGWAADSKVKGKNPLASAEDRTYIVQSVARHYTD